MISMEQVLQDVGAVYQKDLKSLPVSRDLPRLARKFSLLEFDQDACTFIEQPFANNKEKEQLDTLLYNLINAINKQLSHQNTIEKSKFLAEVNLQIHETLTTFLVKYHGEDSALVRVLKASNQSVVIATLAHVRQALLKQNISFKDCYNQWFLSFHTGESGNTPVITQRRIEQVIEIDKADIKLKFKFEWELGIEFDSLECNSLRKLYLKLLSVDFSNSTDMDTEQRQVAENKLRSVFEKCEISCDYKLKTFS